MKVSDWIRGDNCSFRIREGGNPNFIPDRVAFIEKTPRVRIRPAWGTTELEASRHIRPGAYDYLNWADGTKGSGPDSEASKAWCDAALKLFGYEL